MQPKDRLETVAKTKLSAMQMKVTGDGDAPGAQFRVEQVQVDAIIESWPAAPKKVAEETVRQYGLPNEATPTLLIWHNNGPWKRTEITSDETVHNFPTPHTDYITEKSTTTCRSRSSPRSAPSTVTSSSIARAAK